MIDDVARSVRSSNATARLLMFVGILAAWMNFGRLQYIGNADSVVSLLVSLQRWTPFYWGQDRFGMLIPLIARPFHHPLANMLVQGSLSTAAGLLVPFLVARYLSAGSGWFAIGALANTLFVLAFTEQFRFDWYVMQPYGPSISLAVAGLLVASRPGFVTTLAAIALLVLAHWVNISVLLIVIPLVLVRGRAAARSLCVAGIGFAGGLLIWRLADAPPFTRTEILPVAGWPHSWLMLIHTAAAKLEYPRVFTGVALLAAIAGLAIWLKGPSREPLKVALIAGLCTVPHWLVAGTSVHVALNDYYARYVLPSVMLFVLAVAVLLVGWFGDRRKYVTVAALLALVMVSVLGYGTPSVKRLRNAMDSRFGSMTAWVLASDARVIVGDYWKVWPAVFHANLVLYDQSVPPPRVFGLTYRSEATIGLWANGRNRKQILAAGYQNDPSVEDYLGRFRVRAVVLGHSGQLVIYRVVME